jgi:peroxiredoxin
MMKRAIRHNRPPRRIANQPPNLHNAAVRHRTMIALCDSPHHHQHPASSWPTPLGLWLSLCLGLCSGLCLPTATGLAQTPGRFNAVLSPGSAAPGWTPLESVDGRRLSLDDFSQAEVILLVFTCNSCPYAIDYEARLIELSDQIAQNNTAVAIIAVNPNQIPADSLENMRERANKRGFTFPYLKDAEQQVANAYGAVRTPEFFVLGPQEEGHRKVLYLGAFDNHTDPQQVTERYVPEAVAAALRGESAATAETPPVGCRIRSAPRRRGPDSSGAPESD